MTSFTPILFVHDVTPDPPALNKYPAVPEFDGKMKLDDPTEEAVTVHVLEPFVR